MADNSSKRSGWAVIFIFWNLGLLIAILVLLGQLYMARLDTTTIANACAEAAVKAVQELQ